MSITLFELTSTSQAYSQIKANIRKKQTAFTGFYCVRVLDFLSFEGQ